MVYSLPPAPPPIVRVESAPIPSLTISAVTECKRGSRDCFPTDRVGYQPSWGLVAASLPALTPRFTIS